MKTIAVAMASGFVALATAAVARAQFSAFGSLICPVGQIGQPCNQANGFTGMCVPAECEVTANQANDAGADVNVPVSCVECGACAGYSEVTGYCSETVACAPPYHCFTGGLIGQGMGTADNPDQYLVLYQQTFCAPWLNDAGCGPYDPALLSQFPPWRPCSGVNPPSNEHCATSSGGSIPGAGATAGPDANGGAELDATVGVTGGFEAAAPLPPAAQESTEDADAPPRDHLVFGPKACMLGTGPAPGGGLLVVGIAAALGLVRRRSRDSGRNRTPFRRG